MGSILPPFLAAMARIIWPSAVLEVPKIEGAAPCAKAGTAAAAASAAPPIVTSRRVVMLFSSSGRRPAAIDDDIGAGDEAGQVAAQIAGQRPDLFHLAPAAHRQLGQEKLVGLRIIDHRQVHL